MSNDKLVNFKADKDTVEIVKQKLEHGEMSDRLRDTLNEIAHGADVAEQTRLKDRLQELRKERREITSDIEALQDKRDEKDREIERVETQLDNLREQQGEYDGALQAIEGQLHEGVRMAPDSVPVKEAARIGDVDTEGVIEAIKERNPDVPDFAFRTAKRSEEPNWKDEQHKRDIEDKDEDKDKDLR